MAPMALALLCLWCRPAAVAPIQPLAWELPYATAEALKSKKKKKILIAYNGKEYFVCVCVCVCVSQYM